MPGSISRSGPLGTRFFEAVELAAGCHADHTRKGTDIPYIGHLLAVCGLVIHAGGGEDEAIAALLHDVLEDRPECVTPSEIERRFGRRVLEIIEGCSEGLPDDGAAHPKRDADNWPERQAAYIAHLADADPSVLRVSCADKVDNAGAIVADLRRHGATLWDRFHRGRDEQLWYYRCLVRAFRDRRQDLGDDGVWLVDQLERQVELMGRLAEESGSPPGSAAR